MTNTPITDISGYFSAIAQTKGNKNEEASPEESFRNVMDNVFKDTIDMPVSETGGASRGKDFSGESLENSDANSSAGAKRDITKNQKLSRANEKNKPAQQIKNNSAAEDKADKVSAAKDKIVKTVAKKLGVTEEQLQDFMANLGLTPTELMNPEKINLLSATILADGDMTSLLTDENLLATVQDLNRQIEGIVQQLSEELQQPVAELKEFAVALDQQAAFEGKDISEPVVVEKVVLSEKDTTDTKGVNLDNSAEEVQESTGDDMGTLGKTTGSDTEQAPMQEHSHHHNSDEQTANVATSNVMMDTGSTSSTPQSGSFAQAIPMAQDIFRQVSQQIRSNVSQQITELQMQLNPENLGTVGLTVSSKEGNVTAHFTAQDEAVRAALESQIAQLKENLEQQGVKVTAVEVTIASHEFEQNLEKGNDQNAAQEEETEKLRKATRKIDLSGIEGDEMPEELDEADAVTAKMMQADGNSMDYKV
ncbi:MAG: flagellar hook-length control protein FliK [Lachnospiraceae bacterium]